MNWKYYIKKIINRNNKDIKTILINNGAKIGNGVFIGEDCFFDLDYSFLLEIGEGAVISAKTIIEFHDSCIPNVRGKGPLRIGKVLIGTRAYIGVRSVVLPGVKIGRGSIIGAGSLVNKNIPDDEVWAGVPVKYICTVDELITKREHEKKQISIDIEYIGEIEKSLVNYSEYKKSKINFVKDNFS